MNERPQFTVGQGFELFAERIELPLAEYTAIASKQADIETYLRQYITSFTTVLPGAFSRRTLVTPLDGCSVDMYVLFKAEHRDRFMPSALLKKLHVTLEDRYEDVALSHKHNVVIIPFENFIFRVKPGFITDKKCYLVPADAWSGWTEYDSISYKEELAKLNSIHKGRLMPLIRMLKVWNHTNGNLFNDYFLEVFVKENISGIDISSYPIALRHIFKIGMRETAYKINDPANLEFEVEGLRDILSLVHAMRTLQQAYRLADIAVKLQACGNSVHAYGIWRKLLPGAFPSELDMVIQHIRSLNIGGAEALKLMQAAYAEHG